MQNIHVNKTEIGLIFFIVISGIILLGNLFDFLTWDIWYRGAYIIAAVVIMTLLYKTLEKRIWAYKISQTLIIALTCILLMHSVTSVTRPSYLESQKKELTDYEFFTQTMELRTSFYPEIKHKNTVIKIDHKKYFITDSEELSYHLKMHPPSQSEVNAFIRHRELNSVLEIEFQSANYTTNLLQEHLDVYPTFIYGNPHIPTDIDLNITENGNLDFNLEFQKVENFVALVQGGSSIIKFSEKSLPSKKLSITMKEGLLELSLPKRTNNNVRYVVKDGAELTVGKTRLTKRGSYTIVSSVEEENTREIELLIDGGKINITTH